MNQRWIVIDIEYIDNDRYNARRDLIEIRGFHAKTIGGDRFVVEQLSNSNVTRVLIDDEGKSSRWDFIIYDGIVEDFIVAIVIGSEDLENR